MADDRSDLNDSELLESQLIELRGLHSQLEQQICALQETGAAAFEIMGLKREKLRIKDRIAWASSRLNPDLIA